MGSDGERVENGVLFPAVESPLGVEETLGRVRRLSKAGRLPGYEAMGGGRFVATVFGGLYDRQLTARVEEGAGGGSRVAGEVVLRRKMPVLVVVVMGVTVWPGVWFLHSLLTTYFGWYPNPEWVTWAWYVPLCLLGVPVLWKQYKAGREEARGHAAELSERIAAAVREG